jgi:hypothetical protein
MANTYDINKDTYVNRQGMTEIPSRKIALITPGASDLTTYPRAIRVYATAASTVTVLPVDATDDANTVVLSFSEGTYVEPIQVRKVTAVSGSPVVHGYF